MTGNEEQKKTKKTSKERQKENNKERHWEREKQYGPCLLVKTSPAEGWRRFHKNTAYARLGVQVFLVFRAYGLGVQVFRCSGV